MSKRRLSRDAQARFAKAAKLYRQAFDAVQGCLARAELGRVPAWVFAVDRMRLDDVRRVSPELAEAEHRRRALRVALHALSELIAFEGDEDTEGLLTRLDDALDSDDPRMLDRFISIIDLAKSGGCIYVNGSFEPVAAPSRALAPVAPAPTPSGGTGIQSALASIRGSESIDS